LVKRLEIRDLPESSQLQLALITDAGLRTAPPAPFRIPLDAADLSEISWYFQEFPEYPFGSARGRAQAVENGFRNLGRLLFETIFSPDPARELLNSAARDNLAEYQLTIVSGRARFLSLPWELLNSPEAGYLSASLGSLVRQDVDLPPDFVDPSLISQQLNVLVMTPYADGTGANYAGGLAPSLVPALESLDVQVELDFVRPPSLQALVRAVAANPSHYHLLHLDGLLFDDEGNITLEEETSSTQAVAPSRLAEAAAESGIPMVFLSAGDRGSRPEGRRQGWERLGQQFVEAGAPVTIVLPHLVRGPAATEGFLRRFYQALSAGSEAGASLASARSWMMDEPHRPTVAGPQVSWDWITPTVYQRSTYLPPTIEAERPNPLAAPVIQTQDEPEAEGQFPAAGQYGLVGRLAELTRLERQLQTDSVVVMSGSTGVGKTEVALGLARWLNKTGRGAYSGGIFYTPFDAAHSASLERVIHEIGTALLGLRFADLNAERQRGWVAEYLKEQPSLLIFDGAENIAGFPPGTPGLLEAREQAELARFIEEVAISGPSRVLLTSRNADEEWLSFPYGRLALAGLNRFDRNDLAGAILAKSGVAPERISEEVPALLDDIQGHPLACQIALPLLKEVPASVVRGELQRGLEQLPESAKEEGRDDFLTALMEYSWTKMSHRSRTHLPFLSLFQRRVMMDILTHITQESAYRGALGEELGWGACRTLLRSGLAAGFLDPISPSVYQIHPAFPRFLGSKLGRQLRGDAISRLESEFVRVYADTADYFMESLYENQDSGATAVLAEEGNLNQSLGLALEAQQWDNAQLILQPLAQVYRMQRRIPELRRLRGQLLEAIGGNADAAAAAGAIDLWLYLLGTDVSESVEQGDVGRAQELNQQLSDYLTVQPDADTDSRVASVYHQFGAIALIYRRLDEAAGCFQRSLEIIESGDDRAAVADDYFALGQVRQYQRLYTEAKEWYGKALDIHQRLPDEEEMVKDYRALGLVTQLKFEHKEAESWYQRARDMVEEHRDEETAAQIYHELGTVCHAQYNFDEAKSWYQQALGLSDRLGNQAQMATELHFLGLLEQDRGIVYEEAEEWFLAALERREELGDRRGAGDECRQLGVLFHEQKLYDQAENWYHQAREIFEEMGDAQRVARTYGQLGMVAEETDNIAGALEWTARTYQLVTEYDLPVMVQVKAHLARLRDKYGEENFARWWLDFTGDEAPADLDVDASGIL
jgi:tetratricopeptide (TPR) repeat protein